MDVGIFMFVTDETVGVGTLARAVEERGFESLWLPEHTHIPVDSGNPYAQDGAVGREYPRTLDPFVGLAFAAGVTTTLKLGTAACLVTLHEPIGLAKTIASLDAVSGGRVLLGVGAGWNEGELRNHGTDPARRWSVVADRIGAMKQIWANEVASFDGTTTSFGPLLQWPKPTQTPHPPVLVGGDGPRALERVLAYGDAWMPAAFTMPPAVLAGRYAELRERAAAAGRSEPGLTGFGVRPAEGYRGLDALVEAGAERAIVQLAPLPEREALAVLDEVVDVLGDRIGWRPTERLVS